MKRLLLNLSTFVAAVLLLASCNGLKKMSDRASEVQYKVTPEILEMKADTVVFTVTGSFPANFFDKKSVLTLTPYIKYATGQKDLEPISFQGESVQENNTQISFTEGGSFTYTQKVPYSSDMMRSELMVAVEGRRGEASHTFEPRKLADGIITTAELVKGVGESGAQGASSSTGYNSAAASMALKGQYTEDQLTPDKVIKADIHFSIQSAAVRPAETKAADVKNLAEELKAAASNEKLTYKGVAVDAYASPDGAYDLNDKLAGQRAKAASSFAGKELSKAKIKAAKDKSTINTKSTAEDWDGFKEVVAQSSLQDKQLILRVLSMYSDPAVREQEIKNITAAYYNEFKDMIWPVLRKSNLAINFEQIRKTDAEIKALISSNPMELNADEMLYAAEKFNADSDLDAKLKIFKLIEQYHTTDWRGSNNVGFVQLIRGDVPAAKLSFERAERLDPGNETVLNNLGVVALSQNNLEDAEVYFETSSRETFENPVAQANLISVYIKSGEYTKAVEKAGNTTSFNAALAKLLAGDLSGASITANGINSPDGKDLYLKAVIAARKGNEAGVISNLTSAIAADASLKQRAVKDVEFGEFLSSEAFQAIVQ